MDFLSELQDQAYDPNNDPHPEDGAFADGVFVRSEDGPEVESWEEDIYILRRYKGVSIDQVQNDDLPKGEEILTDNFNTCMKYFEILVEVLRGQKTEEEADAEFATLKQTGDAPAEDEEQPKEGEEVIDVSDRDLIAQDMELLNPMEVLSSDDEDPQDEDFSSFGKVIEAITNGEDLPNDDGTSVTSNFQDHELQEDKDGEEEGS